MLRISLDKIDELFEAVNSQQALYIPTERHENER